MAISPLPHNNDRLPGDERPAINAGSPLSVEEPGDTLALVQHTFGQLPEDSLVLTGLADGTVGGHLRIDLSTACARPQAAAAQSAHWIAGPEAAPAPEAVLAVIFTAEPAGPQTLVGEELMAELSKALEEICGVPLLKTWYAGGGFIRDAACRDRRCCAYPGLPVESELAKSIAKVPALSPEDGALDARSVLRVMLTGEPAPSAPEPDAVWEQKRALSHLPDDYVLLSLWDIALNELLHARAAGLGGTDRGASDQGRGWGWDWVLQAERIALMLRSLSDPAMAESLLVLSARGIDTAHLGHSLLRDPEPPRTENPQTAQRWEQVARSYAAALIGQTQEQPHWHRIEALEELVAALAPYARRSESGAELGTLVAMRGWIEWVKGRGSLSAGLLETAVDQLEPAPLLFRIADYALRLGPCRWARVKQLSYGWWAGTAKGSAAGTATGWPKASQSR